MFRTKTEPYLWSLFRKGRFNFVVHHMITVFVGVLFSLHMFSFLFFANDVNPFSLAWYTGCHPCGSYYKGIGYIHKVWRTTASRRIRDTAVKSVCNRPREPCSATFLGIILVSMDKGSLSLKYICSRIQQ